MATKRKYRSDAFGAIHASAEALHKVGAISKRAMRTFDAACLSAPAPLQIKQTQEDARGIQGNNILDSGLSA